MIGRELAADLGVRVGDRFSIQTGTLTDSVRVTALVDLGVKDLNRRTVFVPRVPHKTCWGCPGCDCAGSHGTRCLASPASG